MNVIAYSRPLVVIVDQDPRIVAHIESECRDFYYDFASFQKGQEALQFFRRRGKSVSHLFTGDELLRSDSFQEPYIHGLDLLWAIHTEGLDGRAHKYLVTDNRIYAEVVEDVVGSQRTYSNLVHGHILRPSSFKTNCFLT